MKKGIKLSTAIFIFVIIILVIGLVWMYVYYNNQNNNKIEIEDIKEEKDTLENYFLKLLGGENE